MLSRHDRGEATPRNDCRHWAKGKDIGPIMKNIQGWAVDFHMHDNPLKNVKHGVMWLKFQLMTIFAMKKSID